MPKFAGMLRDSYQMRGHTVQIWTPKPIFFKLFAKTKLAKWAGYIDQYILFPIWVRVALRSTLSNTLFVFSDQALGPWVPLVEQRPHVVHAHDLLALRSALGLVPENPTSWSGRLYQHYIRAGFRRAKNFISVSNKTKNDLVEYGNVEPFISEVVYNGLNFPFKPVPFEEARHLLAMAGFITQDAGVILHISGNQWYKNVVGVIRIYAEYTKSCLNPLPLWLIGVSKTDAVIDALTYIPASGKVEFYYQLTTEQIEAAYAIARVFLFPSHAEGFGWPIVEAQACGCPVITTNEAPMNEIGGPRAIYLPRLANKADLQAWSRHGAEALKEVLNASPAQDAALRSARLSWAAKFDADTAVTRYLEVYKRVLALHSQ